MAPPLRTDENPDMSVRVVSGLVVKPGRMGDAVEALREVNRCIEALSGVAGEVYFPTMGDAIGMRLTGYWDFESNAAYGEFTDRAATDKPLFKALARAFDADGPFSNGFNRRIENRLP